MSSNGLFMERFPVTNREQVISDSSQIQLKGLWFFWNGSSPLPWHAPFSSSQLILIISLSFPYMSFVAVAHSHWIPVTVANSVNATNPVLLFFINKWALVFRGLLHWCSVTGEMGGRVVLGKNIQEGVGRSKFCLTLFHLLPNAPRPHPPGLPLGSTGGSYTSSHGDCLTPIWDASRSLK